MKKQNKIIFKIKFLILFTNNFICDTIPKLKRFRWLFMTKINLKYEKAFFKTALTLAIPIAFQNLLTSCATLIDTAMIVGLGNSSVSAMGVATRFTFLLNVVCFGFASGCSALLAQFWGAKDNKNIKRSLGLALSVSLAFGLIFALALVIFPKELMNLFTDEKLPIELGAGYLKIFSLAVPFLVFSQIMCSALRSVEKVNIPLYSAFISVLANVFINYCLINGNFGFPALGINGAAIGSVVGCFLQALFLVIVVLVGNSPFKGKISDYFSFKFDFVKKYFKTAFPVLLNETLWAVGTNVYVMVLARQGIENHSGYTLYENIQQIFFVFFAGICGACSVMTGMKVGSGEHRQAYSTAKRFAVLTPIMGIVLGGALIIIRDPLLSLFDIETQGARVVASQCLLFYGFWIAMRMIPYTLICGVFRAGGDTKTGCKLDLFGMYLMGIPALLITAFVFKPTNFVVLVAVMFIAEDTLKGILCIKHFSTGKWIKQITDVNVK